MGVGLSLYGLYMQDPYGDKRICREGPVLVKEEIIWQG